LKNFHCKKAERVFTGQRVMFENGVSSLYRVKFYGGFEAD